MTHLNHILTCINRSCFFLPAAHAAKCVPANVGEARARFEQVKKAWPPGTKKVVFLSSCAALRIIPAADFGNFPGTMALNVTECSLELGSQREPEPAAVDPVAQTSQSFATASSSTSRSVSSSSSSSSRAGATAAVQLLVASTSPSPSSSTSASSSMSSSSALSNVTTPTTPSQTAPVLTSAPSSSIETLAVTSTSTSASPPASSSSSSSSSSTAQPRMLFDAPVLDHQPEGVPAAPPATRH